MIRLSLLLALVPLCLSNYLPILPTLQGNKPRVPYRIQERSGQGYYGSCDKFILRWAGWGSGLDGQIRIKEKGEAAMTNWRVVIEFDKPVTKCHIYDAENKKISDKKYEAKALSWNGAVAEDQEKVLNLQVNWQAGTAEPKPVRINIDGRGFECMAGGAPSTPDEDEGNVDMTGTQPATTKPPSVVTNPPQGVVDGNQERGIYAKWPKKVMGLYVLLADDDHEGFRSDDDWKPKLYPYQQTGANVLFFTFIHPETMAIPPAFKHLAATRGSKEEGSIPEDTVVLFAIGKTAFRDDEVHLIPLQVVTLTR